MFVTTCDKVYNQEKSNTKKEEYTLDEVLWVVRQNKFYTIAVKKGATTEKKKRKKKKRTQVGFSC